MTDPGSKPDIRPSARSGASRVSDIGLLPAEQHLIKVIFSRSLLSGPLDPPRRIQFHRALRLAVSDVTVECRPIRQSLLGVRGKNFMFVGSDRGGDRAAVFYTLIKKAQS